MRIGVTGCSGYLGTQLCVKLLQEPTIHELVGLDTKPLPKVLSRAVNFKLGTVEDYSEFAELFEGCDVIVHLAAIVGDKKCASDVRNAMSVNVNGTKNVVKFCTEHVATRLVFASTCSVYGAASDGKYCTEESELNPLSYYAESKIEGEELIKRSLGSDPTKSYLLRFGSAYGHSQHFRDDLLVNYLVTEAVEKGEFTIFAPDVFRPYVNIADITHVILEAVRPGLRLGGFQTMNVGSDASNSDKYRLVDCLKALFPELRVSFESKETDLRNYRCSFDRVRNAVPFYEFVSLEKGIEELARTIHSAWVDWGDFSLEAVKMVIWPCVCRPFRL